MATEEEPRRKLVPPAVREGLLRLLAYTSEPLMRLPDDLAEGHQVVRSWLETTVRDSPAFSPGMLVATVGVAGAIPADEMMLALAGHLCGDWGDVNAHDWCANDQSLRDGTRLLSAYTSWMGVNYWIITEADRSATTFLLPDEY